MERLAIVNEHTGQLMGYSLPRAEAIAKGEWCRTTNVFVVNSKGEILCHQRSLKKERLPGGWSTHLGGHVCEGEDFNDNACKELAEEAGITVPASSVIPWRTSKLTKARVWVRDFATLWDGAAEDLTPQEGEVEKFAWMSFEEIMERSQKEPHLWFAGTHDFATEYACLRAVLAANAATNQASHELQVWYPFSQLAAN